MLVIRKLFVYLSSQKTAQSCFNKDTQDRQKKESDVQK